jgi:DNA transformation protein
VKPDNGFLEYLRELFAELGPVTIRAMFGGHGVYFDGRMIALVADQSVYLKVDDEARPRFEAAGSVPFVYAGKGKPVTMSYWLAPDGAMDDAHEMLSWARLADAAARRASAPKPPKPPERARRG